MAASNGGKLVSTQRLSSPERMERLLAIVPWVAAQGTASLDDVAERFDYPRTRLEADLSVLMFVGASEDPSDLLEIWVEPEAGTVTVEYEREFNAPLRLSPEEALTLISAGEGLLEKVDDRDGPLARGLAKVAELLGVRLGETVTVDLGAADRLVREAIDAAIDSSRTIEIDYFAQSSGERRVRRIDPMWLRSLEGEWYVGAWSHEAQAGRTFRVDRIAEVVTTDDAFEHDDDAVRTGLFDEIDELPTVTLVVDQAARWVVDYYPNLGVEERDDGGAQVRLAVSGQAWLERLLLQLGPHGRVESADAPLGTSVGPDVAQRLLERYGA